MAKTSETVEAILGLVLGIPSILVGSWLVANTCNLVFPTSSSSYGCQFSGSNLLGLVGIIFAALGAIAVLASITVLIGRKRRNAKT